MAFRRIFRLIARFLFVIAWLPLWWGEALADIPALDDRDIAFYYGSRPPVDELRHFDQVVIQPSQILPKERAALLAQSNAVFAYVSIGEVARNSVDVQKIQQKWAMGENPIWNSLVMDMAASSWRDYLLEHHFARLWQEGYRSFFLDTVDSYLIVAKTGKAKDSQEAGVVELLKEIKQRFPGVKLILNRGFEILDRAAPYTDAMLAESLFHGFDPLTGKHLPTKPENRQWLINQLNRAQKEFSIPVIVLDYVDTGDWELAEQTAAKIIELGFMPWVANGDLTWLGQGRVKVLPRKILTLHSGITTDIWNSPSFKFAATPLEHLGYSLEHWFVEQIPLPVEPLAGRYAGVLVWLPEDSQGRYGGICARLQKEIEAGVPVVFMGAIPQGIACKALLNYEGSNTPTSHALQLASVSNALARPAQFPLTASGTIDIKLSERFDSWMTLKDSEREYHAVGVGSFGGIALAPHVMTRNSAGRHQWLLDPFAFFSAAFRFKPDPVFDFTTENGRRIGIVELRGDKVFGESGVDWQNANELLTWVSQSSYPVTFGVVEAEFDSADKQAYLQNLASLKNVRLANHSYSHPFFWPIFDGKKASSAPGYRYAVYPDKYSADFSREFAQSRQFVSNFQPHELYVWSGDGKPGPAALANLSQHYALSYGGGGYQWQAGPFSLADLSPQLRVTTWGTQVLTPLIAENVYAKLWYGPALNYSKSLEWNSAIESQRRLRAHSLTLHADAWQRPASGEMLKRLSEQRQNEQVLGLWVDEYAKRVSGFHTSSIAQSLSGDYEFVADEIRTLRVPSANFARKSGVNIVGQKIRNDQRYIFMGANKASLLGSHGEDSTMLRNFNGVIQQWNVEEPGLIHSSVSIRESFHLTLSRRCKVSLDDEVLRVEIVSGEFHYKRAKAWQEGVLEIDCR